jgi:hypothetical protein
MDSEMTLTESHEIGEEEKGIGEYVVRLKAICAKY